MAQANQGIVALWVARHLFDRPLKYIGHGGEGKQVRDFLHIDDLADLVNIQLADINKFNGEIYNVGGGEENSFSLLELTDHVEVVTKKKINFTSED